MRRLWLLRHAKSSWDDDGLTDEARPLSERGRHAAARMAEHLAGSDVRPQLVLCSLALRARSTLAAVLPSIGDDLRIEIGPVHYTFDSGDLLGQIRAIDERVSSAMIVGHNPALQEVALILAGTGAHHHQVRTKLPTCALVTIDLPSTWMEAGGGTGEVTGLVTPHELEG
jgi:phosphohistidine phosphatase